MAGHIFSARSKHFTTNPTRISDVQKNYKFAFIYNATYCVDIFFFLSGFLMCYIMLKQIDRGKGSISIWPIYVHRIFRLYPSLIFAFMIFTFVLPAISHGPFAFQIY